MVYVEGRLRRLLIVVAKDERIGAEDHELIRYVPAQSPPAAGASERVVVVHLCGFPRMSDWLEDWIQNRAFVRDRNDGQPDDDGRPEPASPAFPCFQSLKARRQKIGGEDRQRE